MNRLQVHRREFLRAAGIGASGLALSGCDAFDFLGDPDSQARAFLERANDLTYRAQRLLIGENGMAQEFSEADIRQPMRPNGVRNPAEPAYRTLSVKGFADYRLEVTGMVERPLSLSLAELRSMRARTQITRHDCVEGWSCIAKWTGVPLADVLERAGPQADARYVVFHCFDTIEKSLSGEVKYYESIDLVDARHMQTILAYGMNDEALPVANGAPLRVRVERQLGYKMAKYIRAIEITHSLAAYGRGKGGYWEDRGYDWYAGI